MHMRHRGEQAAGDRYTRAVLQHMPYRDRAFSLPRILRPVGRYRVVEIDLASLRRQVDEGGNERLARRVDQEQRSRWAAYRAVEHDLALMDHAYPRTGAVAPMLLFDQPQDMIGGSAAG
jgi:hypothetical protein